MKKKNGAKCVIVVVLLFLPWGFYRMMLNLFKVLIWVKLFFTERMFICSLLFFSSSGEVEPPAAMQSVLKNAVAASSDYGYLPHSYRRKL